MSTQTLGVDMDPRDVIVSTAYAALMLILGCLFLAAWQLVA
jgi:hypothetical protein